MSKNKALIRHIDSLTILANERAEQLAMRLYYLNYSESHGAVITALQAELDALIAQGKAALFELLLNSSHRSFIKFLQERDQC